MLRFLHRKWPYFAGFAILEACMYYINGPRGNFFTGIAGMFTIWMFYTWTIRNQENDFPDQNV